MNASAWMFKSFSGEMLPDHWKCPICQTGTLAIKGELSFIETYQSKLDRRQWDADTIEFRFSGILQCGNPSCSEIISFCGNASQTDHTYFDGDGNSYREAMVDFVPTYFNPPLFLFPVSESCPQLVRDELIKAFSLFWSDTSSCANKIRVALEALMDHQKIRKWEKVNSKSSKERQMTLHSRIAKFREKEPILGEHIEAIKWIGNAGAHSGRALKLKDILIGFELLEHCIEKLYEKKEQRFMQLSKAINRRKGPSP